MHARGPPRSSREPYPADVHEEILEQLPHVVAGVDLLHLHLRVHVAVIEEVNVRDFHLEDNRCRLLRTHLAHESLSSCLV